METDERTRTDRFARAPALAPMPVRGSSLGCSIVFGLVAAFACAEQEDSGADLGPSPRSGGAAGSGGATSTGGFAGTLPSAGSSNGGTTAGPGTGGAGGSTAGSAGKGGASGGGGTASGTGGGTTAGSTGTGGSAQTPPPLGCLTATGGATGAGGATAEGGAPGAAGSDGGAAGVGSAGAGGEASGGSNGSRLLFFDDFEDGAADGWQPGEGSFSVTSDGSFVYRQALVQNRLQFSMVSGSCWADQVVEARVKADFNGQSNSYVAALFARALSAQTHYMLVIGGDGKLALRKRVNSTSNSAQILGTAFQPNPKIAEDVWYTLRLEIVGTSLTGYLDGVPRISATDSSIASGGVAVGTLNATAVFDDVRVGAP
jgi:hypothetical protein